MTDKQIDLLLRANVKGKKDLDSVAKSISDISTALDEQGTAAKRGQKNIDEIQGSMAALSLENKRLKESLSALNGFEQLNARVTRTEETVTRTKGAYEKYRAELAKTGNATKEQAAEENKLAGTYRAAETRLEKLKVKQAEVAATLNEFGFAADNAAASEARLTAVALEYARVVEKGRALTRDYSAIRKAATEAERADNEARAKSAQDLANKLGLINAQVAASRKKEADALAAIANSKAADAKLNALADDAEKAARSFDTLWTASKNLRPSITSVRDAVNGILSPTQVLRSSLGGVEGEVNSLSSAIRAINGPVKDYAGTVNSLKALSASIGKQSSLADEYARQRAALSAASAEYTKARKEVSEYAAAVRLGGEVGQGFTKALSDSQARARAAAAALTGEIQATRTLRTEMRAAGLATGDLAANQQRLVTVANQVAASQREITTAVEQYGQASEQAAVKRKPLFGGDGERTTLGLIQRIRGEVLALAASYVGLYGVIETAKGAITATSGREGAKNQLGISVGTDRAAIDAEYEYVKGQSDRIGLEFERAIKGYAKFSAAATLAGRGRQEIRYIFESFSEVGRVANLTADDLDGVFKALEQIFSKGSIQAEELRGQLGDRLFGAFEIAAKSLKDQFPDLEKAMKGGLVTSDQLVLIAGEYKRIVADELPAATTSLAAQQMRMNNAVYDFKLLVADSGWANAYKEALVVLVEFMKSEDGTNAAKGLSEALTAIANTLVFVVKHADEFTTALQMWGIAWASLRVLGLLEYLQGAVLAMRAMPAVVLPATASVTTLAGAVNFLTAAMTRVVAIIGVGIAAFQFGSYLRESSAEVRVFSTWMVTSFAKMFAQIKFYIDDWSSYFSSVVSNTAKRMVNSITGLLGIKGKISLEDDDAASKKRRAALEAELATIEQIRKEMYQDDVKWRGKGPAVPPALATANPGVTANPAKAASSTAAGEAAANKLQSLMDSIRGQLDSLEGSIDRAQTETLQKQLDAIDMRYESTYDQIQKLRKLNPAAADEAIERLIQLNMDAREVAINKFNKGLADDFSGLMTQLDGVEAATGRKSKDDLKARQDAIQLSYSGMFTKLAEMRAKYAANDMQAGVVQADNAKAQLEGYIEQLKALEATKVAKEKLTQLEATMNGLIKARDAKLGAVAAQKEVGGINSDQAAAETNRINQESVVGIQAAAQATRDWALANTSVFANTADRDAFLATLDAVVIKQGAIKTAFGDIENAALKGAVEGINSGLNSVVDNLQSVFNGQQSVADGFMGILQSFGQFAAKFLRDIAMMIIQQQIFNMMAASGGGTGTIASIGKMALGIKHAGGVIGVNGAGNRTRNVDASWFASAPRYHSGGVPGLRSDEYATILQKGEEVLAKDSPRNVMNGGGAGAAKSSDSGAGMRVVLVDDRSKVHEAMNSSEGERVIVQAIRRNIPSVKQMLKG